MSDYPGAVDSFSTKVDNVDDVLAAHVNALQAAIVAVQNELGTDPAGAYATVKAWLEALAAGAGSSRETLTANRTYYVRTDGSDSNDGLTDSSGGAFLTIQHAVDVVAGLDMSVYTVTIKVGDGTYTDPVQLKNVVGWAADGQLILEGNTTTPSSCVISTTSANCITGAQTCSWDVKGFKLQTTTYGSGVVSVGGKIRLFYMDYGACATYHLYVNGGYIYISTNYSISGSATCHVYVYYGKFYEYNHTITFLASITVSTFAFFTFLGAVTFASSTFILGAFSVTGQRYYVSLNAVVNTNSGGPSFFPGSVAGATATGGQYT